MEKTMENQMETGIILLSLGSRHINRLDEGLSSCALTAKFNNLHVRAQSTVLAQ